ncbi:MAG: RNA polymerase sigma factor [Candidatus Zixiibacteriota bacterium]|nr:MAG: RNA polymerase sigma factor [candidate division Zixibacteria bacterium]
MGPANESKSMDNEEIQLITRARSGDDAAFARLVERHDARVMSLVRSVLGPGFDAEEVYQEVFLKVHRSLPEFRFESEFTTWLHRVAVNAALSRKRSLDRRRAKERVMDGDDDFFQSVPCNPWDDPENRQLRREILEQIERALETLPARQRTVFVMKHDQGLKLKEIARLLGIGEGTAKAYLFRAVETLRRVLEPYYQAGE